MKTLSILLVLFFVCAYSRTIRWTSAGGTALWDFSRNWDCNCVPTADDNVIIDVPNIPGNVRIAATAATCLSLTVGGQSQFGQSLYIQGQLSVGSGGAVINSNGDITLDSSPSAPLVSDGVFSGSNRFTFKSGTLAGKGQFIFESLNMTTPALKQINASTTVRGLLWVLPGAGQNALIDIAQQSLQVVGNLQTEESLTIFTDDSQSASLDVTGSVTLNGAGKQYILRGYASIAKLNVNNGDLTIQNSVDITNINIAQSGSVTIIGGPENQRNFGNVSGDGILVVQGGTNTIKAANLAHFQLLSGKMSSDSPLSITNLNLVGGELAGKTVVSTSTTSFVSATVTSATINTANLDVGGFSTLSGATLVLGGSGKVSTSAQFTLDNGSVFSIIASGQFVQNNPFALVPGASPNPPLVNNDGSWTSGTSATIVVNVQGKGSWSIGENSVLAVTGTTFSVGSAAVTGSIKFLGVTGTISSLSGSGYVEINGKQFIITSSSIATLSHLNGDTTLSSGSVGSLTVANGNFIVGSQLTVTNFNFTSGVLAGRSGSVLSAAVTTMSTASPKNFQNILLSSKAITWDCSLATCPLVSTDAVVTTSSLRK